MDYTRWALPLLLLGMVMLLGALLKWTFSRGHSVTGQRGDAQTPPARAVLRPVRVRSNFVEAEIMRLELRAAGVEAELGSDGPRVLVLVPEPDFERAAQVLLDYPR